ncbi:MAG: hypothetical protein Q9223_003787 [Gallowayella weberi]
MSLQETLPLFLALSAVQNALQESTITELWMRLAAGYIALSYVEQVLIYNINHPGLLERFFRWGYEADCDAEENSDEWYINKMFGADESVVRLWEEIKEEHMQAANRLSIITFQDKVSEFLMGLVSAHPTPWLTQLERGKINGMSRKWTAAVKSRAGIN